MLETEKIELGTGGRDRWCETLYNNNNNNMKREHQAEVENKLEGKCWYREEK